MSLHQTLWCIGLALLATSLDNLGQGVQKAGSEWMEDGPAGLLRPRNLGFLALWVAGILMCIGAPISLAAALAHGPASIVSALGAFGLVPLYLFAHYVLGEQVNRFHWLALATILLAVGYIGYESSQQPAHPADLRALPLLLTAGMAVLIPAVWSLVASRSRSPYLGMALGCLSGALGGLNLLILKVGAVLHSWWASGGAWIVVSTLAFLILQVAYRRSTAVQIVPANTAVSIVVPVVIAPFAFDEPIQAWLVVGVVGILAGIAAIGRGEQLARPTVP